MRLEDLNRCAPEALREFFGPDRIVPDSKNIGGAKVYGELYRDFVAQLRLPEEYIQEMHSTRYARHFYTPLELEASVTRWRANSYSVAGIE